MKRKYILLLLLTTLIILFSNCSTQKDLDYLINKFPNTQRDILINEILLSDSSLIEQYSHSFAFDIYLFGGESCNLLSLESGTIDTTRFSDCYFRKKLFIDDFIEKDKILSDAVIGIENTYLFDTLTNQTKQFKYDIRKWNSKKEIYLYDCFPQQLYDLIGYLLYNKTIDYVFAYPTNVHHDENIISTELGMYFGVKGKKVYVIIDNWTSENQGDDPQIVPIAEYLDCCWEEMTNVTKK